MSNQGMVAIITGAAGLLGVAGCYTSAKPIGPPLTDEVVLVNRLGPLTPYPCANLKLIASTPVHIWRHPDYARFTEFRLHGIDILRGPGKIERGRYAGGGVYPFLVWQQSGENIILSPGFNPVAVLGASGMNDEYARIRRESRDQGDWDADSREAERSQRPAAVEKRGTVSMLPLFTCSPGSDDATILIDHSMLVFLLRMEGAWSDLRRQYRNSNARDGVVLVCRTVAGMSRAHRLKWPSYQWNSQQRKIIDWCEAIAPEGWRVASSKHYSKGATACRAPPQAGRGRPWHPPNATRRMGDTYCVPRTPTGTHVVKYDAWNRLVYADLVQPNYKRKYYYDGLNRMVHSAWYNPSVQKWDVEDHYYNHAWQRLQDYSSSEQDSALTLAQTAGGAHVWSLRYIDALITNGTYYYTNDANFNVTSAVSTNGGDPAQRFGYDPYGQWHSYTVYNIGGQKAWYDNGQITTYGRVLYAGYYADYIMKFYHVRNRVYNSALGGWMQRASAAYPDGTSLYWYARANSVHFLDAYAAKAGCAPRSQVIKWIRSEEAMAEHYWDWWKDTETKYGENHPDTIWNWEQYRKHSYTAWQDRQSLAEACENEGDKGGRIVELGVSPSHVMNPQQARTGVKVVAVACGAVPVLYAVRDAAVAGGINGPVECIADAAGMASGANDLGTYFVVPYEFLKITTGMTQQNQFMWAKIQCGSCRCDRKTGRMMLRDSGKAEWQFLDNFGNPLYPGSAGLDGPTDPELLKQKVKTAATDKVRNVCGSESAE